MKIFLRLAARIDEKAFLSFRLWQFSLRNIARHFFWHYLFHALLRHPVRAVAGARHYRRLVSQSHGAPLSGTLDLQEFGDLPEAAKLLIAPGYCMKPYDYEKGRSVCPAGHFNHQCRLLDEATTLLRARERWPAPCRRCSVAPLAEKAAQMRADFYIMTSAMDIARDVYIPATRQKSVQYGLFFLCPYS
ncbi:hypothetical protein JW998_03885, partial [candidate division KSB1 bacterium]|nr:hypothetical protein [candidate division KSB1 bacterium]